MPNNKRQKSVETPLPRQNTPQERDLELYRRLDELSRLRFRGNENLFGDLCIEIGAAEHYEHRSILAQILREGKWRTEARDVKPWLRGNLAKRVERLEGQDDFDASYRRRKRGPRFDKRSGVLIEPVERPFVEFEMEDDDGQTLSGEDAVSLKFDPGDPPVQLADRDTPRFLRKKTWSERLDEGIGDVLRYERTQFDGELAQIKLELKPLAQHFGLDDHELEVLAVRALFWAAEPYSYLNVLDGPEKKRMRNAMDRVNRRLKNAKFGAELRRILRKRAVERRNRLADD